MKQRKRVVIISYIVLAICIVVSWFPIYWGLVTALKPRPEFFSWPPTFWPRHFTWQHFVDGWNWGGGKGVFDSAIVALFSTGLSLIIGLGAAYSIARWKTGGRSTLFYILTMRMIPPVVPAIGYYLIIRKEFLFFPLFDTHLLLICLYSLFNIPFVVWIMRGFFAEIPRQLEEAAELSGASRIRAFWDITLPLAKPGLVATSVFCMVFAWNEFLYALFLTSMKVRTLPKVIPFLVTEQEPMWGAINAVTLYSITPMIIIVLVLQKYLLKGLSYGAIKG